MKAWVAGLLLLSTTAMAAPPNIIVVLTDDQRADSVTRATMPHTIRYVQRQGVTFPNAFATTALCCPSRATFLSGLNAAHHGVLFQDGPQFVSRDEDTLATRLKAVGYRTGIFGKYLNDYHLQGPPHQPAWYVPPGWDVWNVLPRNGANYYDYDIVTGPTETQHYGTDPADYSTDVLRDRAAAFAREAIADKVPFFAYVTPFAPHQNDAGFDVGLPVPAPRHAGRFASLADFRPPSYAEAENGDKPSTTRVVGFAPSATLNWIDAFRRAQMETLLAVDDTVRELYRVVRRAGVARDTIIVVTSDNGHLYYEHRLFGKNLPYEEAHRVPLAIRYPRRLGRAQVQPGLVVLQDVTATLLLWAGADTSGLDGRPFTATCPQRAALPMEAWGAGELPRYRGVRTPTHKYVEWYTGEEELYDLTADPFEMENQAGNPALSPLKATLHAQMVELGAGG